jgi:A/G-specific adenine glycosylase
VVVSEFMLQQTQVDRVVPRFESFVRRFKGFEELARATEEEIVGEWSGLGYYRRARLLHQLAREVVSRQGGLPMNSGELSQLPGIGPYTAAAVASLAFGEAVPVLDGNVMRVGARVLAMEIDPRSAEGRRKLESWVTGLMNGESPGEVNEALMELGATVCSPTDPACNGCPLASECAAKELGRQGGFPPPRKRRSQVSLRWVAACVVDSDGLWLLRRIDHGPILEGLWLPPLAEIDEHDEPASEALRLLPMQPNSVAEVGPSVRHSITHRKIDVIPVRAIVSHAELPSEDWCWVHPKDPGLPTSSLLQKLVKAVRSLS